VLRVSATTRLTSAIEEAPPFRLEEIRAAIPKLCSLGARPSDSLPRLDTLLRRDGICGEGGARARERGAAALRTPYLGHLVVVFVVWVTGWRGIEQLQCLFVTHIGESNEAKIAHTTNIVIISIMLN
jgi:hypothetical protein